MLRRFPFLPTIRLFSAFRLNPTTQHSPKLINHATDHQVTMNGLLCGVTLI
jgi:hypothetical protein